MKISEVVIWTEIKYDMVKGALNVKRSETSWGHKVSLIFFSSYFLDFLKGLSVHGFTAGESPNATIQLPPARNVFLTGAICSLKLPCLKLFSWALNNFLVLDTLSQSSQLNSNLK